jgi:photosystem II stability/assembly factor-like uncharacterized protein
LEALIRQARARQRRRWILLAAGLALTAGVGLSVWAAIPSGARGRHGHVRGPARVSAIRQIEAAGHRSFIVETGAGGGVAWADNGGGFWLTANGGRSWGLSVPPHVAATGDPVARIEQVQFVDRRHGWISASDVYGGFRIPPGTASVRHWEIDRTTDGGRTWRAEVPPGCLTICRDGTMSFVDARHGYVLANGIGGAKLFSTRDGGAAWTLVHRTAWQGSIAFVDRRHGVTSAGHVFRETSDGGHRWFSLPSAPRPTFSSVRAFGRRLVLFGIRSRDGHGTRRFRLVSYMSSDGGGHWQARVAPAWLPLGPPENDISTPTAHDWVAPSSNQLSVTHDAGRTWHLVRPADLPRGWFISQIDFTSPRVGWAIFAVGGQHLFESVLVRTTDGGGHWAPAGPRAPRRHHHRS